MIMQPQGPFHWELTWFSSTASPQTRTALSQKASTRDETLRRTGKMRPTVLLWWTNKSSVNTRSRCCFTIEAKRSCSRWRLRSSSETGLPSKSNTLQAGVPSLKRGSRGKRRARWKCQKISNGPFVRTGRSLWQKPE